MTDPGGPLDPILYAVGNESAADLMRDTLSRAQRVVRGVRRVDEALRVISTERFGLAIIDHRLEDGDTWPILEAARSLSPRVPVIVLTEAGDEQVAAEALDRGASAYLIRTGGFWDQLPKLAERVSRDAAVQHENALLASIVKYSDDAILAGSLTGEVMSWNPAAERIFGYRADEVIGRSGRIFFPKDQLDELADVKQAIRRGEHVAHREAVRVAKDGRRVDVAESISPIRNPAGDVVGAAIVLRDIHEQKDLEAQFRQSQKMEAVGRLAGGIAHDFNNMLTVITGYSELLYGKLDARDPLRKDVDEIRLAGERASRITQQLLAFSRKQVSVPHVVSMNDVIRELGSLLRRLIGEDVDLTTVLEAKSDRVRADAGQLDQVIVNLAVNARDAMPTGGQLTISTHEVELDAEYARHYSDVRPGAYVMVAVTDTGCGMDAATVAHAFEPFFTTKAAGQGTGLGLSTVHGIVKQSGGHVAVYSELGHGSTFKVYLPRVDAPIEVGVNGVRDASLDSGAETVLLAEDDMAIRGFVRTVLEARGYKVLDAADGRDALILSNGYRGTIHILVTDVVMQSMGGPELARGLAATRPDTRVLYMSGYPDEALFRQGRLPDGAGYLPKPFTADQLLRNVRTILDSVGT